MGMGDWGFGDWGLGIGPNPQSPIPNPHRIIHYLKIVKILNKIKLNLQNKINKN